MLNLKEDIEKEISTGITTLFSQQVEVSVQQTLKEFEGTYTFVVFPLVKIVKKNPVEIATTIGNYLVDKSSFISSFNVVKGFLNLNLKEEVWANWFASFFNEPAVLPKKEKVLIEFSSPNTNKPLHLGHLRNNFLGDSLARILKKNGNEVHKVCLVNDRGIHICKSMLAYEKFGNQETPESSGLKGDHLAGKYYVEFDKAYKKQIGQLMGEGMLEEDAKAKAPLILEAKEMLKNWENGNADVHALWQKMNNWVYAGFNTTYKNIGIEFEKTYFESTTYLLGKEEIEDGLKNGVFYKKDDGSVWIDLKEEGLDEKLVLRADGTSVYMTQDLGTTELKFDDFKSEKAIWVVGNEQDYHFKVLFAILKKLGKKYADGCYHLSYGMVDLPSGKMKSREGTVVDADQLLEEMILTAKETTTARGKIDDFTEEEASGLFKTLALGALKYFLLKVEPKKRMLFDPQESIDFQGNTGPFIQYTYARINSILKKVDIPKVQGVINAKLSDTEKKIIYLIAEYPKQISKAAEEYSPSVIANFIFELAKTFNSFYADHSIIKEEDLELKNFRILLLSKVATTIKDSMLLLGINVPDRM